MTLQPLVRTPSFSSSPRSSSAPARPRRPRRRMAPCHAPTPSHRRRSPPLTPSLGPPPAGPPPRPRPVPSPLPQYFVDAHRGPGWPRLELAPALTPLSPAALPLPHPSSTGPSGGSPRRRRPRPGRRPAPASRLARVRPLLGYGRPLPRPCARSPVARLALWATAQWCPRPPFLKKRG